MMLTNQFVSMLLIILLLLIGSGDYLNQCLVGAMRRSTKVYQRPCDYAFFCDPEYLYALGNSHAFVDSKSIVDLVMKADFESFESDFRKELFAEGVLDNVTKVREIVYKYFDPPGQELEEVSPDDWVEDPFENAIKDVKYKQFALDLNAIWKQLTRRMSDNSDPISNRRSSFLQMPYESVVPGGRFREIYYWDSYWTIQGLLACKMQQTVKRMIQNMLHRVDLYWFVPNGGRVYYTTRSQPPFLTLMMKEYVDASDDTDFLKKSLPLLNREYDFWVRNRSIMVNNTYRLFQYRTNMAFERPESFIEDNKTAQMAMDMTGRSKEQVYIDLSSAAESGWDFSSRWLAYTGPHSLTLYSIRTTRIVPVCLNAILYKVAKQLEEFHREFTNNMTADHYRKEAESISEAIQAVLWSPTHNSWYDYDLDEQSHHHKLYASNFFPLWAGSHNHSGDVITKIVKDLELSGFMDFQGGFATSNVYTQQQWDFPNAWAPLQEILIEGLLKQNSAEANKMAMDLMRKWLDNNYFTYYSGAERNMFEKYKATEFGYPGEGGEYDVQVGFGWSNGVVLKYLVKYGDILISPDHRK